jgi:acetyl-CoA synthetase
MDMTEKVKSSAEEISNLLVENRRFEPAPDFRRLAVVQDSSIRQRSWDDPVEFWETAAYGLHWYQPWTQVLQWEPPNAKWFVGGKLNACYNCCDRHITAGQRNKAAIIWEGEPGESRVYTYWDLYREVNLFANSLKSLGVRKGDRVTIYLPMIPEAVVAMLACARIGAIHSVVFGGFSAEALRDRINDAGATVLITADGGWRRGQVIPLKHDADYALRETPGIRHVVVVNRGNFPVRIKEGRDHWYHRLLQEAEAYCPPEQCDSEDPLFILHTSGTTGKPKGIMHTTGGYLTGTFTTTKHVFDLRHDDVYWCTADIGWVTGHSYLVYGPLAAGATCMMYEGSPDWPDRDRFWSIVERHGVSILYTAPTAIRAFMKWGTDWPARHNLSSLRLLGSVGEPINPEAWIWYYQHIGGGRCPIVDTWWQTETGMIMITTLPGVDTMKPGSAGLPVSGVRVEIYNASKQTIPVGGGLMAVTHPWPAMLRGIWGDPERYQQTYWSKWDTETYFTADGAKRAEDGYITLLGRVDDVLNVAGHRIGTMEIESAMVDHPSVAEAAAIGIPHAIKGQALVVFVTLKEGFEPSASMETELKEHVVRKIGAIVRPERITFSVDLPKTRSGKIMRRLLRDIGEGKVLGDISTLADSSIVDQLKRQYEEKEEG